MADVRNCDECDILFKFNWIKKEYENICIYY